VLSGFGAGNGYIGPNQVNAYETYVMDTLNAVQPGCFVYLKQGEQEIHLQVTSISPGGDDSILFFTSLSEGTITFTAGVLVHVVIAESLGELPAIGSGGSGGGDDDDESEVVAKLDELIDTLNEQAGKVVFLLQVGATALCLWWGGWFWVESVIRPKNSRRIF
jgi:hypothetical protein